MRSMKHLPSSFFNRPTLNVARDLIGCHLVRKQNGKIERHVIVEAEAYDGPEDLACHAAKGRTPRTEIMFGEPGHFYVYFVYGMHWMLNIVTGPKDYPAGVLIRGIKDVSGPARVTKKLNVTGALNGKKAEPKTGLWIEKGEPVIEDLHVMRTPRIGINYAGPIWSKKLYRFVLKTD